jgi:hypothetical protein
MQTGKLEDALSQMRGVLEQTAAYDEIIFSYYNRLGLAPSVVLRKGIPETPRAAAAFFSSSLSQHDNTKTRAIWNWASARRLIGNDLTNVYVKQLIDDSLLEEAADTWASYLAARHHGYGEADFLYNASFEYPLTGSLLDWKIRNRASSQSNRDGTVAHSGNWSIRMRPGSALVSVSQDTILHPGVYSLEAWVRSVDVSPLDTLSLRASDEKTGLNLASVTMLTARAGHWTQVTMKLSITSKSRLLKIAADAASSSPGNRGTIWIDDVALRLQKRF